MNQGTVLTETEYEEITPYENYVSAIRDTENTRKIAKTNGKNLDFFMIAVINMRLIRNSILLLTNSRHDFESFWEQNTGACLTFKNRKVS